MEDGRLLAQAQEYLLADLELQRQEVDSMNQSIKELRTLVNSMGMTLKVMLKND